MRVKAPDPIPLITDDMYISQKDCLVQTRKYNKRYITVKNSSVMRYRL